MDIEGDKSNVLLVRDTHGDIEHNHLVEHLVQQLKSKGLFDQFRKECISDVDTKPAYQNLRQRVETTVSVFLSRQKWSPDLNKNQVREKLRKHILDSNFLDQGVERIVDQVVNPKISSVFIPQVEDLVYQSFGVEKPDKEGKPPKSSNPAELSQLIKEEAPYPDSESEDKQTGCDKMPESKLITLKHESVNNSEDSSDSSKEDDFESPVFEPIVDPKMERNTNSQSPVDKSNVLNQSTADSDSNTSANNSSNGYKGKTFESSFKNITLEDAANITVPTKNEVSEYKFNDYDNSTDARHFEAMDVDKVVSEADNSLDKTDPAKPNRSSIESKSSEIKNTTDVSMDSSESKESSVFIASAPKNEGLTFENKIIPLNETNPDADNENKKEVKSVENPPILNSPTDEKTTKEKSRSDERKLSSHSERKDDSKNRSSHSKHSSSRRDSDRRHSSSSSHHKTSSHSHDRDKSSSSKDRHRSSKSSHHSKHSTSDSKHRSDDKSRHSSHRHSSSSDRPLDSSRSLSHKSKSSTKSSHDDRRHPDSRRRSSHSSEKKSEDKKKKSTDYCSSSVKESKNRRSADRDSNDGNNSFSKGGSQQSSSKTSSHKSRKSSAGDKCSNGNNSSGPSDTAAIDDIINISAGGYIKSEFDMFQPVVKKPLILEQKKAIENGSKKPTTAQAESLPSDQPAKPTHVDPPLADLPKKSEPTTSQSPKKLMVQTETTTKKCVPQIEPTTKKRIPQSDSIPKKALVQKEASIKKSILQTELISKKCNGQTKLTPKKSINQTKLTSKRSISKISIPQTESTPKKCITREEPTSKNDFPQAEFKKCSVRIETLPDPNPPKDTTDNDKLNLNPVVELERFVSPILKKPKIASNIYEARKLMRVRKNMAKQEREQRELFEKKSQIINTVKEVFSEPPNAAVELAFTEDRPEIIAHYNLIANSKSPLKFFDNSAHKQQRMQTEKIKKLVRNILKHIPEAKSHEKKLYLFECDRSEEQIFKRLMPENNIINITKNESLLNSDKDNQKATETITTDDSPASPENIQDYGDNNESLHMEDFDIEKASKNDIMEIILGRQLNFEANIVDLQQVEAVLPIDSARSTNEPPGVNRPKKRKVSFEDEIDTQTNVKRINMERVSSNEGILCEFNDFRLGSILNGNAKSPIGLRTILKKSKYDCNSEIINRYPVNGNTNLEVV